MPVITLLPLSSYPPSFALLCHTRVSHVNKAGWQRCFSFPASGFSCLSSCFWGFCQPPWGLSSCRFQGHLSGWFQWFLLALQPASGKSPRHPAGGVPASLTGAWWATFQCISLQKLFTSSTHIPEGSSSGSIVHTLAHGLLLVRPGPRHLCSTIQWATPIHPLHQGLNLSPGGGGTVGNASKYFLFAFGIKSKKEKKKSLLRLISRILPLFSSSFIVLYLTFKS